MESQERSDEVNRLRYRYKGCRNGVMYWERPIPGDSRVEQVRCSWDWFWGRSGGTE